MAKSSALGIKSLKTRTRILETARLLFNAQGMEKVSMRQIAESADMATGNLTYHYSGKNKLGLALFKQFKTGLEALLERIKLEDDPDQQWEMGLKKLLPFLVHFRFFFQDFSVLFRISVGARTAFRQFYPQVIADLSQWLESLQEQKLLSSELNAKMTAEQMAAVLFQLAVDEVTLESNDSKLVNHIEQLLRNLLAPHWIQQK